MSTLPGGLNIEELVRTWHAAFNLSMGAHGNAILYTSRPPWNPDKHSLDLSGGFLACKQQAVEFADAVASNCIDDAGFTPFTIRQLYFGMNDRREYVVGERTDVLAKRTHASHQALRVQAAEYTVEAAVLEYLMAVVRKKISVDAEVQR